MTPPSSFQYRQLCNFVQQHRSSRRDRERRRRKKKPGRRHLARVRPEGTFKLLPTRRLMLEVARPRRVGFIPTTSAPVSLSLSLAAETQLTRLPPPLWPLAVTQRRKPPPPATKKTTTPLFLSFCPLQKYFQNRNDSWANEIFQANPIY